MTEKELTDKLGTMHLIFLDDSRHYGEFVSLLMDYEEAFENYGVSVIKALNDGLENAERYLNMESALSPRSIIIEKRTVAKGMTISKADAEGCYRIWFVMDDESKIKVRFDRKLSQVLYILVLMFYQKNGLLADFFLLDDKEITPILRNVMELIKLIYPHMDDKDVEQMAKDLASDRSFTDALQKMKAPLVESLDKVKMIDDLYWFMPYAINLSKKQLYKMHIAQSNISFPEEFLPIINVMPDAYEYLKEKGIDTSMLERDFRSDFTYWQKAAKKGNADGLYYTGAYYGMGKVVAQDYQKSKDFLEKAANKGHLDATFQLGVYYMFGFGVEKDIYKALELFEKAAAQGHAEAASWAGQIYERETDGVKQDYKKAFNLYMIAANQNNEEAMWFVIQGYLLGHGTRRNFDKAYQWFKKAEALGYYKISTLFGIHYFNQGDKESLRKALRLFIDGVNAKVPQAYYFMGRMAIKGFCKTNDDIKEAKEWFLKGAMCGEKMSINTLRENFPVDYIRNSYKFERKATMRDTFIQTVKPMNNMLQEEFINMVFAYREKWQESYLAEMCKQLSIHKPSDEGSGRKSERRITVRKTEGGRLPYEVVLTLANGEEVIVNKFYPNSLVLLLLTIICSMKSGYTTMMAINSECRPVLRELARLVNGKNIRDLDRYVEETMGYEMNDAKKLNEDYYKQYSNKAKTVIKAAVGVRDEAICFLFENARTKGRKIVRKMVLDSQYIDLPQELMDLAHRMPDALDILQITDNQKDKAKISE